MTTRTDQELTRAVVDRDRAAFSELYTRYAAVVGRRLRRIMGSREEAEDLLQQTFLEMHRSIRSYDESREFGAWLHGIAINLSIRAQRANRRRAWLGFGFGLERPARPEPVSSVLQSDEQVSRQQLMTQLQQAIETLSSKKRVAFTMHELEGLNHTEIGELLNETPQTVWARVESAKKEVKKYLAHFETRLLSNNAAANSPDSP